MAMRSLMGLGFVGVAVLVAACSAPTTSNDEGTLSPAPETSTIDPKAKAADGRLLNLSHFECNDDGTVNAHFVLLFAGKQNPGTLYVDSNQGSKTAEPYKNSGNVWHYNVTFAAADIILYGTTHVGTTPLHNPTGFDGGECGTTTTCDADVATGPRCANPSDVSGDPDAKGVSAPERECAWLGLTLDGKQETQLGSASQSAAVAIVVGGNGGQDSICANGERVYNVYKNVTAGDVLETGNGTGISHITYCNCN